MKKDDATASRFLASLSNAMKCAIVLGAGVVPASAANLTHSIEVSSVGRSLGMLCGEFIKEREPSGKWKVSWGAGLSLPL